MRWSDGHFISAYTHSQIIYKIVYRLCFHPLSKYPGPWLAAITNWYAAFYVWRGDSHLVIRDGHRQYGDIVRFGPDSISVITHTGMAAIYSTTANVRKDDGYLVMSASLHAPNTISSIDKKSHAFKKRILAQVFTNSALRGVEDRILLHTKKFCDMLLVVGLSRLVSSFQSDEILQCFVQSKLWRYKLDRIFFASLLSPIKTFGAWIRQQAKARTKLGNNISQKDCFHHMLNAKDPKTGQPFTERELWTESLQLIVAGSDTIAVAMSAAIFHLVHNQEALSKLTEEVRSCFAEEDDIRMGTQLNSCTFLRACITETLRLSPPFADMPTRRVLPGGINVDGHHLPEGTVVGTPIYAIHHDRRYYPRPFKFEPERWLETGCNESPERQRELKLAQVAFCPFSIGPRTCVAKNMAWVELSLIIARTVFRYDMRLPGDHLSLNPVCCADRKGFVERSPEYQLKAWIASGREGPSIQFRPREKSVY
ncbi:unnamed protein product [Penicillium olsonii]|nr:unnamed protein product [Penicillium olsonii]